MYNGRQFPHLVIEESEVFSGLPAALGFLELSLDEQIAKKIYEATGDKTFKGFLPFSWNTAQVVKMRDISDQLKSAGKLTAFNMAMKFPGVSQAAHQYFITNAGKIRPPLPTPQDLFKTLTPILWIAGLATGAYLLSQVKAFLPKPKGNQ
jgi:hypothetical protein